ncbi:MAG: bifunctional adenosylcobinamide kinase/adenosylcobinamide-phosphate guanylyltransferase [Candidatus Omnitrophica bacterium]|nr:bifunctional adenosylcobinamide kinase/adenosylcobinamide-phosphate guanylyltransferase [Candidatus Omnitrophota bacterium]
MALQNKTILVTGGSRSGKSKFAQGLAASLSKEVVFIATADATAMALDKEMRARIYEHKKSRPKAWKTIEEPIRVADAIVSLRRALLDGRCGLILIDCLTLFVSNLFSNKMSERRIELEGKKVLKALQGSKNVSIIVTNELGMGIVPENRISRKFRDIHGRMNQLFAGAADEVYFMISGLPIKVKPGFFCAERRKIRRER